MSAVMDMYLSASDSMSFQDMLDIDIKSEIESLVGGHNDFSGLNFSELPPLELDDVSDIKWFSSNSNHSNSSFNLDFNSEDGTRMVNPNAVMPVTTTTTITLAQNIRSPSPMLKESHLTFSPATIKISSIKQQNDVFNVKKDLLKKLDDHNDNNNENKQQIIKNLCKIQPVLTATAAATTTAAKSAVNHCITTGTITTTTNTTNIINGNLKQVQKPSVFTFKNTINRSLGQQINNLTTVRTISTSTTTNTTSINHCNNNNNNNITNNNNNNKKINNNISNNYINNNNNSNSNNNNNNNKMNDDGGERVYPKPAYSYSCLIAMALKNSRSGSLPVSEIYNFMCKHFPYFITAPNGWKNSVRHNLSLNKCFEKIEKPAINGTQRKGCLWAMNPAKISKMDEEVQKWSRKDPTAIRNAMVNPENLEPLERGELKFSCSYDEGDNFADSCSAESEEGSDCEQEIETNVQTDYETTNEIKTEIDDGNSDLDIEVHSSDVEIEDNYYEDMDDDKEMLRMEMALAQKELMEYEKTVNNKRRRTYIVHN